MSGDTIWILGGMALAILIIGPTLDQINRRLQTIIDLLVDIKIGRRDF